MDWLEPAVRNCLSFTFVLAPFPLLPPRPGYVYVFTGRGGRGKKKKKLDLLFRFLKYRREKKKEKKHFKIFVTLKDTWPRFFPSIL